MAKSKKQKEQTEQVQARLTGDTPLRLDVSATKSGRVASEREKGYTGGSTEVHEIHPSLDSVAERLTGLGVDTGQVTTSSGTSVPITKGPRAKDFVPHAQGLAPERGKESLPPVNEGISQRFEQRIGRDHGPEKVAALTAEADAVAARPNPLRSDGHVDMLTKLHGPSMGGNSRGLGGGLSALAKRGNANLSPAEGHEYALHQLGYGPDVQQQMFGAARDQITRRQGRGLSPALSQAEINSRAYGQVNEHLDEAIHGTRASRPAPSDPTLSVIQELAAAHAGGSQGFDVRRNAPGEGGGLASIQTTPKGGPGMTKSRTPTQRAQREAVRGLVRGGKWQVSGADVTTASKNDLDLITARQKARTAQSVPPEERSTLSAGADPEMRARRLAQPTFSTGKAAPFAPNGAQPGVGVAPKGATLAPRKIQGAVSPVPSDLPSAPAKLGRTREERGIQHIGGESAPIHKGYGDEIAAYMAGRPSATPKNTGKPRSVSAVPASESNVDVAQTETKGVLSRAGLGAARKQNVSLGERAPQGARSKRPTVR